MLEPYIEMVKMALSFILLLIFAAIVLLYRGTILVHDATVGAGYLIENNTEQTLRVSLKEDKHEKSPSYLLQPGESVESKERMNYTCFTVYSESQEKLREYHQTPLSLKRKIRLADENRPCREQRF